MAASPSVPAVVRALPPDAPSVPAVVRVFPPSSCRCVQKRPLFDYGGFVSYFTPESPLLRQVLDFRWRPTDVVVDSFAKAGTTWTQEMVYLLATDLDFEAAKKERLDVRFPYLEFGSAAKDDGLTSGATRLQQMPADKPRFIKTHLPHHLLSNQPKKMIYVTRNPKDVMVSYYKFLKNTMKLIDGSFQDFFEDFLEDKLEYCPMMEHVLGFWENQSEDLLFITYEAMKADFKGVARKVASFLGKNPSEADLDKLEAHCSFGAMKSNDMVNFKAAGFMDGDFMRKGIVGDWKNHFTPEMNQKLRQFEEEKLAGSSFSFTYEI